MTFRRALRDEKRQTAQTGARAHRVQEQLSLTCTEARASARAAPRNVAVFGAVRQYT